MKTLLSLGAILFALLSSTLASSPQQFCFQKPALATDICVALASSDNSTTGNKDLALHFSVSVPDARNGWAAFGIGDRMNGALMFMLYPGANIDDITVSIRTTTFHKPPHALDSTSTLVPPEMHVTRTWVSDSNLLNAQIICYDCGSWQGKSWTGKKFDIVSSNQPWIWATNNNQETGSDDLDFAIKRHTDFGHMFIDMESAYMSSEFTMPEVTLSRVSSTPDVPEGEKESSTSPASPAQPSPDEPAQMKPVHHKHSPLGVVSIHGFLLTIGFLLLSTGVLAIRSGFAASFKAHWIVQTVGGSIIALGYLLGIYISFKHGGKFSSVHQLVGLTIVPTVGAQGVLGYTHHMNFVKYKSRTAVSYWHIWIGRVVLVVGNLNVLLGLTLSHASTTKFYLCIINLSIQITILGPMWYFWSKGHTIRDVISKKDLAPDYESVEQEAFILEDESDDEAAGKGEELELKRLTEDEP